MIKTALKTAAVTATLAGAAFMASPASAGVHPGNDGQANGNNIHVTIVGGYGVTCGSVSLSSQTATSCDANDVENNDSDS
jgi:hypothetical protein